ncbi:MAG TPA: chloride channel protein [Bryobacteraceae bacterium]|nr:chloride channel protein [Bryobacteraceae bacterium]
MEAVNNAHAIPATLGQPSAPRFWVSVVGIGILTGLSAGLLTKLLEWVQRSLWGGNGREILDTAQHTAALRVFLILLAAGVVTGIAQVVLRRLSSGNDIDTTAAIWFHAGKLPSLRTLASATLSVVLVGMGVSLGREGAPKQAGAVFGNFFSDLTRLSDDQRRLLVACGAGAGMAAAYGVPLGGALFAIEVVRGALALRFILPALLCSAVATAAAWTLLPNMPTYQVPPYPDSRVSLLFAVVCGLVAAPFSVVYVRFVRWAERNKPSGWQRIVRPIFCLALLGIMAIRFPQLLGNGRDVSQLLFAGAVPFALAALLLVLKPAAIVLCIGSGVPGGLFTPSLTSGALLGSVLGYLWSFVFPHVSVGLCGFIGAGAVLSATTQGPVSTIVLMMELTGQGRSFLLPLLLAATIATMISRSIEPRSIYDARLTNDQIQVRQRLRDKVQVGPELESSKT